MAQSHKFFVNLNELPENSRICELCDNHFSDLELNGAPGYAVYPVRLPCSDIFCYDCARMWISHAKCPECDARFAVHTVALEAIDEQIRQYRQYQVACFNARLQAGMIRAPPGYPTFASQQAGPSRWWHEDDTAKTAVSKKKRTDGKSELSKLFSFDKVDDECYLAAQTLLSMSNPVVFADASKTPSIEVTGPEGQAVGLERVMAARRLPNADIDDRETFAITESNQTAKEFRTALNMINKVNGTNVSREDFPNLKLKYERKRRG